MKNLTSTVAACIALGASLTLGAPPRYEALVLGDPIGWTPWYDQYGTALSDTGIVGVVRGYNTHRGVGFSVERSGEFTWLLPLPGDNLAWVAARNTCGVAVGDSGRMESDGYVRATPTAWVDGEPVALESLGGEFSSAVDLNSHGTIVGVAQVDNGSRWRACTWTDVGLTLLPEPAGAESSAARAISDTGVIVGHVFGSDHRLRATRWLPGALPQVLPITDERIEDMWAVDINDAGDTLVVVSTEDPIGTRSGLWLDDAFTLIPVQSFYATSINNHGQIVGSSPMTGTAYYVDGDGAFLLSDLIDRGPTELVYAEEIDDRGWIIGAIRDPMGRLRAAVLKPIDEGAAPSSEPGSPVATLGTGPLTPRGD